MTRRPWLLLGALGFDIVAAGTCVGMTQSAWALAAAVWGVYAGVNVSRLVQRWREMR